MRRQLSIGIFLVAVTIFAGAAKAQEAEQKPLSPLQSHLEKMQSGEAYGMKTMATPPAETGTAESKLSDDAKALANRAMAQGKTKEKSRLEKMEAAYNDAPVPAAETAAADAARKAAEEAQDKAIEQAVKDTAEERKLRDARMLYEGINMDQPKTPPRLIPVE